MSPFNDHNNITVKPDKTRLQNLLEDIQAGALKIPVFQRDFVWKANQMLELFDSIAKGYPIGSLLFWKPEAEFKTKEYIGPFRINKTSRNVGYVLDGFQRLTTLLGVLINPATMDDVNESDLRNYQVYYDLKEKEFTYLKRKKETRPYLIPLYRVLDTFEFLDFLREIELKIIEKDERRLLIENAKALSKIFYDYEIPFVEIRGGNITSAVQIFSRVNSTGTEISEDFMLSALSYNQDTDFLFSDHITEFINSLSPYNFDNLKRDTVLNCIANSKGRIYFDVKIEELLQPDLEFLTYAAFEHIRRAVEFVNRNLHVVDAKLLPYPTQLIFISEFFRIIPNPSNAKLSELKRWFWITTYSNYFTIYSLSLQRAAYHIFLSFLSGGNTDGILRFDEAFRTAKFPEKINFTGVRTKALQLFMLQHTYRDELFLLGDGIKEIYFFNKKDRTPGNVLILTMTDYDRRFFLGDVSEFFSNIPLDDLPQYFLNEKMIEYYNQGDAELFISAREEIIKLEEQQFVEGLEITYDRMI